MKIGVSSTGKDINDEVAEFFGRSPYFIIIDISGEDGKEWKVNEVIKNENTEQMSGAGVLTAKLIAEKNVNVLIAGNVGPRALDVLKQFNIEVYFADGKIKKVLREFMEGKIEKME